MVTELDLYVSAAAEMDAECELLGQALARMPDTVKWVIKRTPQGMWEGNPDLEYLRHSDFYLLLLGMDVKAPMGVEWRAAQESSLARYAYRKREVAPSPAASVFARRADLPWQYYRTPREFARDFEERLIRRLVAGTPGYGLDLPAVRTLSSRLEELSERQDEAETEDRRGAGAGGVILTPGG